MMGGPEAVDTAVRSHLFPPLGPIFPRTYEEGRALWEAALARVELPVARRDFPCPEGPGLATATALLGDPAAPGLLAVLGGTHGVEGFAGTALQCDLLWRLACGQLRLPEGVAVLLVNALNPWGYRHFHRHDRQGVDLNRNFVDFANPPDNPDYPAIRALSTYPPGPERRAALAEAAERLGRRRFEIAATGGQYQDPRGPFYGGRAPAHGRRVVEALLAELALGARRAVAVVDVHTGLGPWCHAEVICDHPPESRGFALAARWFGPALGAPALGSSSSVPKWGLIDYAFHAALGESGCFVTLEFGTYGTEALLEVLWDDLPDPEGAPRPGSEALRRHFWPEDPVWREALVLRGRQVLDQALAGVAP